MYYLSISGLTMLEGYLIKSMWKTSWRGWDEILCILSFLLTLRSIWRNLNQSSRSVVSQSNSMKQSSVVVMELHYLRIIASTITNPRFENRLKFVTYRELLWPKFTNEVWRFFSNHDCRSVCVCIHNRWHDWCVCHSETVNTFNSEKDKGVKKIM